MTDTDLRALLESRRAQWLTRITDYCRTIADTTAALAVAYAHVQELEFALEQLPEAPAVVKPEIVAPAVREKAPRELGAEEILQAYDGHDLPAGIDDLPTIFAKTYNTRTLRAGLELAHKRRAKESHAGLPGEPLPTQPPVAPEQAGVGAELEMQNCMRMTK